MNASQIADQVHRLEDGLTKLLGEKDADITRLRTRNEELRQEVYQLREQLGLPFDADEFLKKDLSDALCEVVRRGMEGAVLGQFALEKADPALISPVRI